MSHIWFSPLFGLFWSSTRHCRFSSVSIYAGTGPCTFADAQHLPEAPAQSLTQHSTFTVEQGNTKFSGCPKFSLLLPTEIVDVPVILEIAGKISKLPKVLTDLMNATGEWHAQFLLFELHWWHLCSGRCALGNSQRSSLNCFRGAHWLWVVEEEEDEAVLDTKWLQAAYTVCP